jgi:hypothetical protein
MSFRVATSLAFAFCALAATACSNSPSTPFNTPDGGNGSPDGSTGNPSDGGGTTDAQVPITGDAGPIGDASISNGGDAAGFGEGGSFDFGCGGHGDCPLTQVCCTNVGPPVSFSCVDPATCPQNDKIECDGPDECSTAAPVCCGVAVGNGTGNFPLCGAISLGASCTTAASCPTFVGNCSQTSTLQVCHDRADCTDSSYECCTFTADAGAYLSVCFDPGLAAAAGGHCI